MIVRAKSLIALILVSVSALAEDATVMFPAGKHALEVREQLNKEYGCGIKIDPKDPNTTASCAGCINKVRDRVKKEYFSLVSEIESAFGSEGLGPETSAHVLSQTEERFRIDAAVAEKGQGIGPDAIKTVPYWLQEALKLSIELEKAQANPSATSKILTAKKIKQALQKKCPQKQWSERSDCVVAQLEIARKQVDYAIKLLTSAAQRIRWASMATYACPLVKSWEPIAELTRSYQESPPDAKGLSLGVVGSSAKAQKSLALQQKEYSKLKNNEEKQKKLNECVTRFRAAKESGEGDINDLDNDAVCKRVAGSDLNVFSKELTHLMAHLDGPHYFDLLRMDALTRFMNAHYELTDKFPDIPPACSAYKEGLERMRKDEPVSDGLKARAALRADPKYLEALNIVAKRVRDYAADCRRYSKVKKCMSKGSGDAKGCVIRPEWADAQANLKRTEQLIIQELGKFPVLKVGTEPGLPVWSEQSLPSLKRFSEIDPADVEFQQKMAKAFQDAIPAITADVRRSMTEFCTDKPTDEGGRTWEDLIELGQLSDSVLKKFPEFELMQKCTEELSGRRATAKMVGTIAAGLGCVTVAALTDGAAMIFLGAACGALMTGESYLEYARALDKVYWVDRCRAAGEDVCSSKNVEAAHQNFDAAMEQLVMAGVTSVIDLGAAGKAIHGIAQAAKAERVAVWASKADKILKAGVGLSEKEAQELGKRINGVAKLPKAEQEEALERVLDDVLALQSGRSENAREIANAFAKGDKELIEVLAKRFGCSPKDGRIEVLAKAAKARFGKAAKGGAYRAESEWFERVIAACKR